MGTDESTSWTALGRGGDEGVVSLRALDANRSELWSRPGFRKTGGLGGFHTIATDPERDRIYVTDDNNQRITALDSHGRALWWISRIRSRCISVDPRTGNLWCIRSANVTEDELVVFDPSGTEISAYPHAPVDMDFDPHSDAFWLVGEQITKLSRDGKALFSERVSGWRCAAASVNPSDGSVWIAEQRSRSVAGSKNRLWLRRADGNLAQCLELGDEMIFAVESDPSTGDALFCGSETGLVRVSPDGDRREFPEIRAKSISVGQVPGEFWIGTQDSASLIDGLGKVKGTFPLSDGGDHVWIAAF